MNLSEALNLRADLQKRIATLKGRNKNQILIIKKYLFLLGIMVI